MIAVLGRREEAMMAAVFAAVAKAEREAEPEFRSLAPDDELPANYFTGVVYDRLFKRLCGADPDTHMGGDLGEALRILGNQQLFAEKFWKKGRSSAPAGQGPFAWFRSCASDPGRGAT